MWWKKRELVFSSFFPSLFFFVEYDLGYHRSLAKKCNFVLWKKWDIFGMFIQPCPSSINNLPFVFHKVSRNEKELLNDKNYLSKEAMKDFINKILQQVMLLKLHKRERGVKPREKLFNGQLDTIRQPKHDVSRRWKIAQVMFKHQLEQFRHHSPHPKLHGKYTTCTFSHNMHCLKIAEKVAFTIASKASYVYILSQF